MASDKLANVPEVEIDPNGTFKYVLIKVYAKDDTEKFVVRGFGWGEYHMDIYSETSDKVVKLGLDSECVGGGRISHDPSAKKLKVYGYSQGYGRADHEVAVGLLKKRYPEYEITWSNDGY